MCRNEAVGGGLGNVTRVAACGWDRAPEGKATVAEARYARQSCDALVELKCPGNACSVGVTGATVKQSGWGRSRGVGVEEGKNLCRPFFSLFTP